MRCLGCKAWKDGKCLAGVTPYRSKIKTDGIGCACNTRTVEKLLRQNRKTNADAIRDMTDEELAEFMCHNVSNGTVNCAFCAAAEFCRMGHNGWLDWLRQEVTDG